MLNDPSAVPAPVAWTLNVVSSVGLILANKAVMNTFRFNYPTTLTGLHFCLTAAAGLLVRATWQSPKKSIPFWTILWFSVIADLSVVTMNISLMTNSVGFYQIAKLSIIPTCCLFEALLHGKTFSNEVKFAVMVVMLGVGVCTVTDVSVNPFGLLAACAAVVSTTLQQIYVGQLQKVHSVGSFDLLSQTAPLQAFTLIASGPLVDWTLSEQSIWTYKPSMPGALLIFLSCLLALVVNVSAYLCIGKFSAVSFQVLGHMKTVLVLVLGWLLFDAALTVKNLGGMLMAVLGMITYSWAVEVDRARIAEAEAKVSPIGMHLSRTITDEEAEVLLRRLENGVKP